MEKTYHQRMPDTLVVLLVILAVVLVWRGPKTLPKLGQALGRTVRDVRREVQSGNSDTPGTPPAPETPDAPDGR